MDEIKFQPFTFCVTQPANKNKGRHVIFISLFSGKLFGLVSDVRLLQSHLSLRWWCTASVDGSAEWCITCPLITLALCWISLHCSWSSSSPSTCSSTCDDKSGTGAKTLFQKIDLLSHTSLILCTLSQHHHTPVISLQSLFISAAGWIHAEARGSRCSEKESRRSWLSWAVWPLHLALSTSFTPIWPGVRQII